VITPSFRQVAFLELYRACMILRASRHRAVLEELTEWWEDIRDRGVGSRVALVQVPPGWGASAVLDEFREIVDDPAAPVAIAISVDEVPVVNRAIEAGALRDALMTPFVRSRTAELLGLETAAGEVQLGLGIGSLFASGLAVGVPLLLGSLAVTAAGNAWDGSPAGQQGALARAARAVAAVSAAVPVTVIIDGADRLDPELVVTMIDNLASRYDGQVLVVASVVPGSALAADLCSADRYGLLGRIRTANVDAGMSYGSRADLARELSPFLAAEAIERIAHRTQTFVEVFKVASADRLADLSRDSGPAMLATVDAVINACVARQEVSALATVLGWAGGALTIPQADRAVRVLGSTRRQDDQWVILAGGLVRLGDPASPRVGEHVATLSSGIRHQLAAAVLDEAAIVQDPEAMPTARVVARLAVHRVRADLEARGGLAYVQCLLIRDLEQLGDLDAAREVALIALAELPDDDQAGTERIELLKTVLRLAIARPGGGGETVIQQAIDLARTNGAVMGMEARVWAAVNLLSRPGQREAALTLANQVIAELARFPGRDIVANQWRVLLAFQVGRAGYPAVSQRLLAPVISSGSIGQQEAAQAVLRAVGGPLADTRLQVIILESELATTPISADEEFLRLHHTLAGDYHDLGDHRNALRHGTEELRLCNRLRGTDHRQTLEARRWAAFWTSRCGDAVEALRLFRELLHDQIRVLGHDHPDVLTTRNNIAACTGESGDARQALRLFRELLPDQIRVLAHNHRDVLRTRNNVAGWTAQAGDSAEALRLLRELLPDRIQVLGQYHPDVLRTRGNIAALTGKSGDAEEASRLCQQLLPDQIRVLGQDHPETLTARSNIATWTGQAGDAEGALRLFRELLTDRIQVQGQYHPGVLTIRNNIAIWTAEAGDSAEALRLSLELLPDRIRVLGADHPDVLTTRNNIAAWTGESGDAKQALRLSLELLPDRVRVLGAGHPDVLTTRNNIAAWTGKSGNAKQALRLSLELLPDRVQVLGAGHPDVLTTRSNIAGWTGESGDAEGALRLFRELMPDQIGVLGQDHPHILSTRNNIAFWTASYGDRATALELYRELLPDQIRILGQDHHHVQITRNNIADLADE
jgi:hypothetical protein